MRIWVLLLATVTLSGCSTPAAAACFRAGTELPDPKAASSPALAAALAEGDVDAARGMIARDPSLVRRGDLLAHAVAGCSVAGVTLLLDAGAPADGAGHGLPLVLALRARDEAMARLLLKRGASPSPRGAPTLPLRTAIGLDDPDRVGLLIAAGADLEARERTGRRALHIALDQERFRIAAQLLDAGADPFAIDAGGANLGSALFAPLMRDDPAEAVAQRALRDRLRPLCWPEPVPDERTVARRAIEGSWPPPGTTGAPVPPDVLALIRERRR